ncbi:MAG: carbohydrate porin [Planctomycetaceae bacterium]
MQPFHVLLRSHVAILLLSFGAASAAAQETCDSCSPGLMDVDQCFDECCCSPYCYDCSGISQLTGDWGGCRTSMAESGITFQGDVTQFYQGVARGGREQRFEYAGRGDYLMNFDMGKLANREGLFLKIRAEHRWGETINRDTGALLPANIYGELPDFQEELLITNFHFTQMLSPTFGFFFGKLDTLDGDANAFAGARGKDQFMNIGFVGTPLAFRTVPYSTLGAGFVVLRDLQPIFQFMAINPTSTVSTTGFDELFEEGVTLASEMRLPTNFLDMPGHQLIGGTWGSRSYAALEQDPRIVIPDLNIPIERHDGSWSLYWNFDQYLMTSSENPNVGWGIFGRAGVADEDTNPIESFYSFGFGGTSPIRCREKDSWGVGWYRANSSDTIGPIVSNFLQLQDGQGYELFYNIAVTPFFNLTADLQIIESASGLFDTAIVPGIRGKLVL